MSSQMFPQGLDPQVTPQAFTEDEIVVALGEDEDRVQQELVRIGVHVTGRQASDALRLALLGLENLHAGIKEIDSERAEAERPTIKQEVREAGGELYGSDDPLTDLDLLLFHLRHMQDTGSEGEEVTIGKNRVQGGVWGTPHIGGEEIDPVRTGEFALPARGGPSGESVRIGVVDTKLHPHPALDGRYLADPGSLFAREEDGLPSTTAHATFIAGIIAQQAPDADVVFLSVLDESGSALAWDVAVKMVEFLTAGVQVLNLSFACVTRDDDPPLVLARAVELLSPSMKLFASLGNHGDRHHLPDYPKITPSTPTWPAKFAEVTAVGATGPDGERASFSPDVPWADVLAPGVAVRSTFLSGEVEIAHRGPGGVLGSKGDFRQFGTPGYARWNGTSFSTAYVCGAVARVMREHHVKADEALQRLITAPNSPIKAANGR